MHPPPILDDAFTHTPDHVSVGPSLSSSVL
jgi:hypothetical protein